MRAPSALTTTSRALHALRAEVRLFSGNPLIRVWHNRHVLGFALANAWRPRAVLAAAAAYDDAVRAQKQLFGTNFRDDVSDAYRHTYASALVTTHLHARLGMPIDRASGFMRRLGLAHEADSPLRGVARRNSNAMDLHNNELGISVAQARAGTLTPRFDRAISDAALGAIAEGRAFVLDSQLRPPRPSTRAELLAALREPWPG